MADFRKQLGLDYLRGSEESERPARSMESSARTFLDDAVIAYGRPMLEELSKSRNGTARLYSLIDALTIPIDVALKVVEGLEARKYLVVVERDLKGNYELQITTAGRGLLA
jgi:hypothetical protein